MAQIFESITDLHKALEGIVKIDCHDVEILDEKKLREKLIDDLIYTAVFGKTDLIRYEAMELIRDIANEFGAIPSSIHDFYMAMGRGEVDNITTPAINIRGMTYDVARQIFKVALKNNVGAFIFEIAKSEIGYTFQRPMEYASAVLAAAIKEGYKGPVFIQGDHFQFNAKKYQENPEKEFEAIKQLTEEAIIAGFYNIDIDPSTLVDYSKPTLKEQQYHNYINTARLTKFIREIEPKGITISVGGEIGHIGGKNSTVEEFEAFMEGYLEELPEGMAGISKISVQTGTEHGGIPLPDGRVAEVKLDFNVLKDIGKVAREKYGLGGTVQHGASTLPDELFDKFPQSNCCEIHLATGFQNIMYDLIPEDFRNEIYNWIKENLKNEWKEGQTEAQFIYKTRKKGFGPFKYEWWTLDKEYKDKIMEALYNKFEFLFNKLNVFNSREIVDKYVKTIPIPFGCINNKN